MNSYEHLVKHREYDILFLYHRLGRIEHLLRPLIAVVNISIYRSM